MDKRLVRISKFLSLILRHKPEKIGLMVDNKGWASINELIDCANAAGHRLSREVIERVVAKNDKNRFALSRDGLYIRANQGHSIAIDLGLACVEPPETLFHGSAIRNLKSILRQGLLKRRRHHVHLSLDESTARRVGVRHGKPVVLIVASGAMHRDGYHFFISENGIWLTEHVPPSYIQICGNYQ